MRFRFPLTLSPVLVLFLTAAAVPSTDAAVKAPPAAQRAALSSAQSVIVPAGWPKLLAIPKFKVRAPVEALKFNAASDVHAPYKWGDVAWYDRGPRPGEGGRATMFGHLDSTCCPAVFWQLHSLHTGDIVQVAYKTGRLMSFRVMWQATYLNARMPLKFMFGRSSEHGLTLVTCAGVFHTDGTGYDHKLVVYARLILPSGKLG